MKKFTTIKTLLVGLCAMGATSAWADDTYTEVYKRAAVTDWSADDATDWNAAGGAAIDANNGLGANASQTATYVNKTFTVLANSKIKYEVDWTYATATGRTNNWNWIQFGSFLRIAINSSYNMQVSTDAGTTWNATVLGNYKNGTYSKRIELIFDTQKKIVESFKFDGTDRTGLVAGNFNSASFNSISTGFVRGGSVGWTLANYLTTVTVSQAEQAAAAEATYTINYIFNSSTIKSEEGTSVEGAVIEANSFITVDDTKYLCTAAEVPSITLASGSNSLDVPVRLPYTATLTVTKEIAGAKQTPVVTTLVETDDKVCNWSYAYPMYVQKDGVYYVADNIETFGETGTFTDGQKIEKTVSYTNADQSVIYFGEPNERTGSNPTFSNGAAGFISGGIAYASCPIIKLDLPAGEYTVKSNVVGNERRNLVIGKFTDTSVFPEALVTIEKTGEVNETITLTETTPISISGKDQGSGKFNQSADIDYVLVKSTTEIVSATIGSNGFATFASGKAVDLEGTGLKAYTGKLNDEKTAVKFTEITGTSIPANTGVLLEGDANKTYFLKVATSASSLSENDFIVGAGMTTKVISGETYFAMVKDSDPLVFGTVDPTTIAIPANKAYLAVQTSASRLTVTFDGEATGIKAIENVEAGKAIYNLNGQRVNKAQKGLYIVNGKKTIIK